MNSTSKNRSVENLLSQLMRSFHFLLAVCLIAAFSLTGCTSGPDFLRPNAPKVESYTLEPLPSETASAGVVGGEAQRFIQGADVPAQWWELFHSPELNALIEKALKVNPTIEAAQAALRQANENVYAQQGAYYPNVQANISSTRQQVAKEIQSPLNSQSNLFYLHSAQVTVAYSPDVFGFNQRQVESLKAQAEYQHFQLEAAQLTLSSNIVVAAVQEASLREQIKVTESLVALENEQLDLLHRQFELGAVAEAAVISQEALLAQVQTNLPALKKQLALQRDLLTSLAGEYPGNEIVQTFDLSKLQLPQEIPLSLPSKLVEQRPDVRAAEEQLHAASAQIGVAQANRLPQFTLSAAYGFSGTAISNLLNPGNNFWLLAGSVAQPVFDGGILKHRKQAAEAAYDQAAAQYKATVITAFQNVADALRALEYDADTVKATLAAERATKQTMDIARRQVELGDISYFALLTTEQAYQQSVLNLQQALASRYSDTAALFQALGGGWWHQGDIKM